MIATDFRRALERFALVGYSMASWHHGSVRLAQARLQEACDQLAALLPQAVQLPAIDRQKAREGHQANQRGQTHYAKNRKETPRPVVGKILLQERSIRKASYRQQGEQGYHRCHPLHTAHVMQNLRNTFLQFASRIAFVMNNDAPQKRGLSLMLAHNSQVLTSLCNG